MTKKSEFLYLWTTVVAVASIGVSQPAHAEQDSTKPSILLDLLACRAITETGPRLACFDAATAALESAEQAGEVAVIDRAQARETRARLFGLNLGSANLFGNLRQDAPVQEIETTLVSARQDGRGRWTFNLADGSTWRQVDDERVAGRTGPGAPVRIREGAMGSYLLSVSGARSVRARREQ